MSRAPVFVFDDPRATVCFARAVPSLREVFSEWAESTSQHVKLMKMEPAVIGPRVHLFCMYRYHCGSVSGTGSGSALQTHDIAALSIKLWYKEECDLNYFSA
jgi:hypothetical protein